MNTILPYNFPRKSHTPPQPTSYATPAGMVHTLETTDPLDVGYEVLYICQCLQKLMLSLHA